jgi:hypothetical protein
MEASSLCRGLHTGRSKTIKCKGNGKNTTSLERKMMIRVVWILAEGKPCVNSHQLKVLVFVLPGTVLGAKHTREKYIFNNPHRSTHSDKQVVTCCG